MDISDTLGLEFLDLSDVDEYEKNRVLASLQPSKLHAKFPWIIGDCKKSTIEDPTLRRAPIPIINPENGLPIPVSNPVPNQVNNVNGPVNSPINNQYYSPVPPHYCPQSVVTTLSNVSVHMPQNYGNYSVPNTSHHDMSVNTTIYTTYLPQTYSLKTPVYYGVPGQTIFISHPNTIDPGVFYDNTTPQYVQNIPSPKPPLINTKTPPNSELTTDRIQENERENEPNSNVTVQTPADFESTQSTDKQQSPLSAETPAFTPKHPQKVSFPQTLESPQMIVEAQSSDSTVLTPNITNNTPKQNTPWGSGKSWASLFAPKDLGNSPQINGMTKPILVEALNKESNNNDVSCPIKNPKKSEFIDPDCYRMGEFLSNYSVDGRAISLQPRGLINQSNYCYINSILQALLACPPMYNLLNGLSQNISSNAKRKPTPVIDGMCKFVKEFNHLPANMRVNNRRSDGSKKDQKKDQGSLINTDIPFEPSWIYKMLNGIRTDLIEGRQEDAEEFLGCLLNNLNDEMLELIKLVKNDDASEETPTEPLNQFSADDSWQVMGAKNKGSILRKTVFERTPITDIFGGSLKSKINRTGDLSTENTQPFLTLQLNIEKVKTVREALEALTAKYQLEGLTSSKTNKQIEAWQQVMLDELPIVLVLHLKCFDFKLDGCTKIIKALEFPIDLKIDPKLLSSKMANAKGKQYKLFAVVYHDGKEATKGHYITDAFHVGYSSWLRYDDASVKQVQEEQVLKPQGTRVPYLLFYRRSDTIRSR